MTMTINYLIRTKKGNLSYVCQSEHAAREYQQMRAEQGVSVDIFKQVITEEKIHGTNQSDIITI